MWGGWVGGEGSDFTGRDISPQRRLAAHIACVQKLQILQTCVREAPFGDCGIPDILSREFPVSVRLAVPER